MLQAGYILAKAWSSANNLYGYRRWQSMSEDEFEREALVYRNALFKRWAKELIMDMDPGVHGTGTPLRKKRWSDHVYRQDQDYLMYQELLRIVAVQDLWIHGFVRTTINRGGAFAKDDVDRKGLTSWFKKNVLSVGDFEWRSDGHMFLTVEEEEEAARGGAVSTFVAGQVRINRIKKHYLENYAYNNAVTRDMLETARCGGTWGLVYLFARGVFKAQYAGMSAAEIKASLAHRREHGHQLGMPHGSKASAEMAAKQVVQRGGDKGYLPELLGEPLFVEICKREGGALVFGTSEMRVETVGESYRRTEVALGLEPHSCGLNSGRRNAIVNVSTSTDRLGMGPTTAQKVINHRGGTKTLEQVYSNDTGTVDVGALLHGGRAPRRLEAADDLALTRCTALVGVERFEQVPQEHKAYTEVYLKDDVVAHLEGELRRATDELSRAKDVVARGDKVKSGRETRRGGVVRGRHVQQGRTSAAAADAIIALIKLTTIQRVHVNYLIFNILYLIY